MAAPSRRLIYVFQEGNLLMRDLAEMKAPKGFRKHVVTVPAHSTVETHESNLRRAFRASGLSIGNVRHEHTQVVVDNTLRDVVEQKFAIAPPVPGHWKFGSSTHVIPAFDAFAETLQTEAHYGYLAGTKPRKYAQIVLHQLGGVIQSIRDQNKEPVLLDTFIGKNADYGIRVPYSDERNELISRYLVKQFGMRAISFDEVADLAAKRDDIKKVVLLVDHDAARPLAQELGNLKKRLVVAAPCPCCVHRSNEHRELGFKVFETEWTRNEKLLQEVNETIRASVSGNVKQNARNKEHPEAIRKAKLEQRK